MAVMHYRALVDAEGNLVVSHTDLPAGTEVEVLVQVHGAAADLSLAQDERGWLKLAESSMDFWDNPVDDAVWNNA